MDKMLNFILHVLSYVNFHLFSKKHYRTRKNPSIYISYLIEPFYRYFDPFYMNTHQNRRETLVLKQVFEELGKGGCFCDYSSQQTIDNSFDIIFGIEPNFERMIKRHPRAYKIYYATGAYYKHQNSQIISRTNFVNNKYDIKLSYSRLVEKHESAELADLIIQIGSAYTKDTYPENLQKKIVTIDQSIISPQLFDIESKVANTIKSHYLWFGGYGSVLKGLDLVLDYFSKRTDLTLHVVGPIDADFKDQLMCRFNEFENIHIYGFLDANGPQLREIFLKTAFIIYPSVSEGGTPGSVLTAMYHGVIPLVSSYASFEGIESCGLIMSEVSIAGVNEVIRKSELFTMEEISCRSYKTADTIKSRFSLENYYKQMYSIFHSLLKNEEIIC